MNYSAKKMTPTGDHVWFIHILFGVFTNKHMQELNSD